MPQAKPVAPPPTPPTPKTAQKGADKVKVRNISKRKLCLTHGTIEPDKVGTATIAECSGHYKFLERV